VGTGIGTGNETNIEIRSRKEENGPGCRIAEYILRRYGCIICCDLRLDPLEPSFLYTVYRIL
jgi:hypothetical protein